MFKNCPPLVILDGYDELLQASGQVFSGYIKDAQRFQEREAEQGRPLRIIITSRVTLIDKAAVPLGATIVRLLEFDQNQRDLWSSIWNKSNATYFRESSIEKFSLPKQSETDADKILTLAEQPLLLLMLALYDSQDNQLRKSKGLDRTKLYDSLLRRFVTRERDKEKGFSDSRPEEQNRALGIEMQRLGVAALGMYNRRKVHILAPELDEDLGFFKLEREVVTKTGKALSQADLLLGSFFFVHKSKAQYNAGAEETHEEMSAFEFLHNTFGEFLTADFILRRAVGQVKTLRASEENESLRSMLEKIMGTADGFERDWYASLVYTPLFTRPVIMEMIREWAPHVFKELGLDETEFVESLEKIVLNQIKRLLNKREMPSIIRKETAQEGYRVPFGDHPLIGHVAIYSLNLVLLRLIVGAQPFVFDENKVASHEDGTRPWDRLIHIWRSWFALGNLNALTAIMLTSRKDSKITIAAKTKFQAEEAKSRLQECLNVALSLGDNVASGLSGFLLHDPATKSIEELEKVEERLNSEGLDLGIGIAIKRLIGLVAKHPHQIEEIVQLGTRTIEQAFRGGRSDELEQACLVLSRAFERSIGLGYPVHELGRFERDSAFWKMCNPGMAAEVAFRDARSGRILWALGRQLFGQKWQVEFSELFLGSFMHTMFPVTVVDSESPNGIEWLRRIGDVGYFGVYLQFADRIGIHPEIFERMFDLKLLRELSRRNPDGALVYIQLLREIGGHRFFDRFSKHGSPRNFFERLFHPKQLLECSERNPEGALLYVQLIREMGADTFLEQFAQSEMEPNFFGRIFHARQLLLLSERNPEATLAYISILREVGGGQFLECLTQNEMRLEFVSSMFHPGRLLELCERNAEGVMDYIQILYEIGTDVFFNQITAGGMGREFFSRMFHPRRLLELSERNPEAALAYIQMLRRLGGGPFLKRHFEEMMGPTDFNRNSGTPLFTHLFARRPAAMAVWLTLARMVNSRRMTDYFANEILQFFSRRGGAKVAVELLPISALPDLRWLASQSRIPDLVTAVAGLTGDVKLDAGGTD